jgi:uncharacterized membrane protein
MSPGSKKNRIIFIDLMRAFAVLQMVQGHTVDSLLADSSRSSGYPVYAVWLFMRGMTAPIFMFTAGTVFMYLFRLINEPFKSNPRVKKGFKRVILLIALGYLLRYPTPTIFNFSHIARQQWDVFFAVDVLHLIGFGILFLIFLAYAAEKFKLGDYFVFISGALIFIILYPIFANINWTGFMPAPLAGYFYTGTGSNFPLFPWAGYVIAGGVLGSYLAKHPKVFKTSKFSLRLLIIGAALIAAAFAGNEIEILITGSSNLWTTSPNLVLFRIGFVLILNSIVSYISLEVETIPRFLILVGRNTLLIYIVHLVILYGSAWNPGLVEQFGHGLNVWETVGVALLMILLMTGMVLGIHKLKIKNKELVT